MMKTNVIAFVWLIFACCHTTGLYAGEYSASDGERGASLSASEIQSTGMYPLPSEQFQLRNKVTLDNDPNDEENGTIGGVKESGSTGDGFLLLCVLACCYGLAFRKLKSRDLRAKR